MPKRAPANPFHGLRAAPVAPASGAAQGLPGNTAGIRRPPWHRRPLRPSPGPRAPIAHGPMTTRAPARDWNPQAIGLTDPLRHATAPAGSALRRTLHAEDSQPLAAGGRAVARRCRHRGAHRRACPRRARHHRVWHRQHGRALYLEPGRPSPRPGGAGLRRHGRQPFRPEGR
ncbi:hypothetical protein CBM2587_B100095 [Cupriavidus taiwanensis]|uniref:Uncharacterized protein n=1 Tax=Cupriavidus taiwanensis TaxID=164546 RepID=A0A976A4H4_9BURK|nr:hypothetical protein CBM2587_B100095 [Cupriavidus taiwanensis]